MNDDRMESQLVTAADLDTLVCVKRGKVRDIYDAGDGCLLIVATARIPAFDVVLPTAIPDKGRVPAELIRFWFGRTQDVVRLPSGLLESSRLPEPIFTIWNRWAGTSVRRRPGCRRRSSRGPGPGIWKRSAG